MDKKETTQAELAIADLMELAEKCDIPQGAFNDLVLREKKLEAQVINNAGIQRQLTYLSNLYGENNLKKFVRSIEETIMDNARRGKTVQCVVCDCTEFLDRCFIKGKQQYICRECHSQGKDS
jgi:hypothetical protein